MLITMIDIQIETEQKLMFQDRIYFCDPEGGNESQALIHGFPSLRRVEGLHLLISWHTFEHLCAQICECSLSHVSYSVYCMIDPKERITRW